MKREDFNIIKGEGKQCENVFLSNERFLFKNQIVEFYYRYKIYTWTYQCDELGGCIQTDYLLFIDIDEESIHNNHKVKTNPTIDSTFYDRYFGFLIKKRTRKGVFKDEDVTWLIERIEKIKIEPKIKERRYQKILGIVNGEEYSI